MVRPRAVKPETESTSWPIRKLRASAVAFKYLQGSAARIFELDTSVFSLCTLSCTLGQSMILGSTRGGWPSVSMLPPSFPPPKLQFFPRTAIVKMDSLIVAILILLEKRSPQDLFGSPTIFLSPHRFAVESVCGHHPNNRDAQETLQSGTWHCLFFSTRRVLQYRSIGTRLLSPSKHSCVASSAFTKKKKM